MSDDHPSADELSAGQAAAADALADAFDRLAPQGSDPWNFLAAFTHLGNRFGPYQPGGPGSSDLLIPGEATATGGSRLRRIRQRIDGSGSGADETNEFDQAMAHVVEAFRFLSARVRTLEERLARQDAPLHGPAWLIPAQELGDWVSSVAGHVLATTPGGEIWHADCGEGALLGAFEEGGVMARGNEPRGAVALRALEEGRHVVMAEAIEALSARPAASLGGLVLSGVVDRLPLHGLINLLGQARRTLALGAPLVVLATDPDSASHQPSTVARELLQPHSLHEATWEVLLDRAGFVAVAPLLGPHDEHSRFAVVASTPT
ncbi:MAG TPA: hypothetical protein VHV57_12510 [Acidimicrobiales bacterium]|nr:hypothetical protein [Acidimicrobiales bacterium]